MAGKDKVKFFLVSPKKSLLFLKSRSSSVIKKMNKNCGSWSVITDHIRAWTNAALSLFVFCYLPTLPPSNIHSFFSRVIVPPVANCNFQAVLLSSSNGFHNPPTK